MAPPPKTTIRSTSPNERGVTRASTTRDVNPDRGVDLGGMWDEHGNYWYSDETGMTWVWYESAQQWQLITIPEQGIQLQARAPLTDKDRAYIANRDAMLKRYHGVPAREFGRVGVMGGPGRIVAKMASQAWSNEVYDLGVLDPTRGMFSKAAADFKQAEAELIADNERRDAEAEARTAHARGELYQMKVEVVDKNELEKEHQASIAAGTTKKVGSPVRAPARVEGFINDVARTYREELVKIKRAEPKATASRHGTEAEKRTLAKVPALAKARELKPGHIMTGNVIVGVTGPRGGQVSAEMGSSHYGFIIELKKSPKAVTGWQAQAHLIAVDNALNFRHGGLYLRIYGENYKPGEGVYRRAMGGALDKKLPKPPRTRLR